MSETIAQKISKKFPIGTVIGDRYRLVAPIALGGMGAIYQAEHIKMHRKVAVKLLRPELTDRDESKRRFLREAKLCAQLNHPNCVTVYDFDSLDDEIFFLAMEYLKGESLAERIVRQGPLPTKQSVEIFSQLLDALGAAHQLGIVHRDVKPSNIMIVKQDDGTELVKLLDFGIAKAPPPSSSSSEDSLSESTITQHGLTVGTPEYIAPEQAMGHPADGRADLYSAGVSLFETLTGKLPFVAETPVLIVTAHVTEEPPKPSAVAPTMQIPAALDAVVLHALQKTPERRYRDAAAFKTALLQAEPSAELVVGGVRVQRQEAPPSTAPVSLPDPAIKAREDSWRLKSLPAEFSQKPTSKAPQPNSAFLYKVILATVLIGLAIITGYFFLTQNTNVIVAGTNTQPNRKPKPTTNMDENAVLALLEKKDFAAAEKLIQPALAQNPKGGPENLLAGHIFAGLQKTSDAVTAYQIAVEDNLETCQDATLQKNLDALLRTTSHDEHSGVDKIFLHCKEKLGALLTRLWAQNEDKHAKQDATKLIESLEDAKVDTLSWFGEALKQAQSCQERLFWIKKIAAKKEARGLQYLTGEEERKDSKCLLSELKKAQNSLSK